MRTKMCFWLKMVQCMQFVVSAASVIFIMWLQVCNKFYPLEFYFKLLTSTEFKYPSIKHDFFSIYSPIKHFLDHLYGRQFKILTDTKAVTYHLKLEKQTEITTKWVIHLQGLLYKIEHIPVLVNPADFLLSIGDSPDNSNLIVNVLNIFNPNSESLTTENILKEQMNDTQLKVIREKIITNNPSILISQLQEHLTDAASCALKKIFRYLKGTAKLKIIYKNAI